MSIDKMTFVEMFKHVSRICRSCYFIRNIDYDVYMFNLWWLIGIQAHVCLTWTNMTPNSYGTLGLSVGLYYSVLMGDIARLISLRLTL